MSEFGTWQPIETAPANQTTVLVYYSWNGLIETRDADGDWWRMRKVGPTHWMPLPSPPSGETE